MPIYEYECDKCGTFEVTQRITEKPLGRCPTCKAKVKKLISNTSFQLKGTGWYITDYARKDNSSSDKSPKGEKVSASDGKGNGKSATASESKEKPAAEKSSTKSTSSESSAA